MRFSIRAVLVIVVLYSVLFACMPPIEVAQFACAIITATAFSGVIMLIRRRNVVVVVSVAIGAVVGAFFALFYVGEIASWFIPYRPRTEMEVAIANSILGGIGAICDALYVSAIVHDPIWSKRPDTSESLRNKLRNNE